jgi:hypothetical protein
MNRIVKCKKCGCDNSFPTSNDEFQLDMLCDECGMWLEEYK